MTATSPENQPEPTKDSLDELRLIRSILLREDREQVETVTSSTQSEIKALEEQLATLRERLALIESVKADSENVVPAAEALLPEMTSNVVTKRPEEMSDALSPIMASVISKKIRESPELMVEAMSPIMLGSISQAIRDAMQELQGQIDARLSRGRSPKQMARRVSAEMQGVSSAELTMRDAMPYSIDQVYLIQNESGLLISHYSSAGEDEESDLVSSMLTAIRDFVGDAFANDGAESELKEVQYGEQRLIVKSGTAAYCALLGDGIEPEGLRHELQTFVATLHAEHGDALRAFNGDPDTLPDLTPQLSQLASTLSITAETVTEQAGLPAIVKLGMGCLTLALLTTLCFSGWFVYSLMPTALEVWQPTPTATVAPTLLPTATATTAPTPTLVPTATATEAPPPTATATQAPTATSTLPATATAAPTPRPTESPEPRATTSPPEAVVEVTVWALSLPNSDDGEQIFLLLPGDNVLIDDVQADWSRVRSPVSGASGWILTDWLSLDS